MTRRAQKLHGQWFLGDVYRHITTTGYFHRFVFSCPYSVKLKKADDNDKQPTIVDSVVFGFHCHEFLDRKAVENKKMMKEELKVIESGQDVNNVLAEKHKKWQEDAHEDCLEARKDIIDKKAAVAYACKRLHLTGRQVVENSTTKMSRNAVDMARLREMNKRGEVTKLDDLIEDQSHHLLKNDGDEMLIFGLVSAVRILAATNLILADGTFKCVLPGFSQLYVFHAVVRNNVAIPMLFCLVKGKSGRPTRDSSGSSRSSPRKMRRPSSAGPSHSCATLRRPSLMPSKLSTGQFE